MYSSEDVESSKQSPVQRSRVPTACSQCRIHKAKCNGQAPCANCIRKNWHCEYHTRRRPRPKNPPSEAYVNTMEDLRIKLSQAVILMYKKLIAIDAWDYGFINTDEHGQPMIHDIIEKLHEAASNRYSPSSTHSAFSKAYTVWDEFQNTYEIWKSPEPSKEWPLPSSAPHAAQGTASDLLLTEGTMTSLTTPWHPSSSRTTDSVTTSYSPFNGMEIESDLGLDQIKEMASSTPFQFRNMPVLDMS